MGWIYNASLVAESKSHYASIVAIAIFTMIVMLSVTLARGFIRFKFFRTLDVDDGLIIVAMIFATAFTVGSIVQTRWGLGLPTSLYPSENIVTAGKLDYANRPLYCITVGLFQAALCITYIRLFLLHSRLRRIAWTLLGAIALLTIYHTAVTIFECIPISKIWSRSKPGHCLAATAVYYLPLAINVSIDFFLLFLPLPLLLHTGFTGFGKSKIITLIVTLLMGLTTTTCAIAQLFCSVKTYGEHIPTGLITWAIVEINAGITTVSIFFIAPFLVIANWRSHPGYPNNFTGCPSTQDNIPLTNYRYASGPNSLRSHSAIDSNQSIPRVPTSPDDGPHPFPYPADNVEPLNIRPKTDSSSFAGRPFKSKWNEIGLSRTAAKPTEPASANADKIVKHREVKMSYSPRYPGEGSGAVGLSFGEPTEQTNGQRVRSIGTETWVWAGKDE